MLGNGKSEIDVEIHGHDIPRLTWYLIGIGMLLLCVGIAASFVLRGSITVNHQRQAAQEQVRQAAAQNADLPADLMPKAPK